MPQKFYIVESEDEVTAKHQGYHAGLQVGQKKGFTSAFMLCLIAFLIYLFFTLQNITYLTDLRIKVSNQLKAQVPQYSQQIDKLIPDGSTEMRLERIRRAKTSN